MAGENEGAQTTTEAPGDSTQSVDTAAKDGGTLLTNAEGKTEGEGKTDDAGKGADDAGKDGGKDGDGNADAGKDAIEYTAFDMPEGVTVDEAALARFTPIAKELGLDQGGAQKLVDIYAEMQAESAKAFADQVSQWGEQTRNDPEIGGAKFDENLKTAITGLQAFASPELVDLLNSTGIGNHPEMIRFCRRVGMALREDKTVAPSSGAGRALSIAERMYPNHKS